MGFHPIDFHSSFYVPKNDDIGSLSFATKKAKKDGPEFLLRVLSAGGTGRLKINGNLRGLGPP